MAGQWYKGNTHAHTSVSDGKFAPEKLIGEYQAELKKVMDRIEEAQMDRRECMSTEGRKRLALLYDMRNSLCFSLKELTKD